ncbi:MAG: flap endonuclease-1 [Crenarchaeota archaeon]|nr:flap endonuclease-1 [Thermoproteota archaeon]MDW8033354.1 flap endonuclease-1 [Nitrososphaerota archaeon]
MGVQLGDIVPAREIRLEDLANKRIAIDTYNTLYQFLTIIRGPDGRPLMDSRGRITSHLSGIFYRTCNFLSAGLRPIYVFDGEPPKIKREEAERRKMLREEASKKYEEALVSGRIEEARKYAQMSATLDEYLIKSAEKLISLMGIPVVHAPSEGEAQAAHMVVTGVADYVGSQDFDSLLFGGKMLVRNLTITGRRKLPGKKAYVEVNPEEISLEETLSTLSITREQLVDIALLVGTDYTEGIKGIGPKRALELVKSGMSLEDIFRKYGEDMSKISRYYEAKEFFLNPEVKDLDELEWKDIDEEGVVRFLHEEHDFSPDRITKAIEEVKKRKKATEGSLSKWF